MPPIEFRSSFKERLKIASSIADLFDSLRDYNENLHFLTTILVKRGIEDTEELRAAIVRVLEERGIEDYTRKQKEA
jgi:hypothetical protein